MVKNLKITFAFILALGFTSCDFIIKKNKNESTDRKAVVNDKIEASLIVKATQKNLNIIALCNQVESASLQPEIILVAKTVKKEQLEILDNLQTIAKENMILVSNTAKITLIEKSLQKEESLKRILISQIQENLDIQKEILDSLVDTSSNKNITIVAEESIQKLKSNIDTTFNTLESLK